MSFVRIDLPCCRSIVMATGTITGGSVNNYLIAASNADAAIETPGSGFTSTNPWANFSC